MLILFLILISLLRFFCHRRIFLCYSSSRSFSFFHSVFFLFLMFYCYSCYSFTAFCRSLSLLYEFSLPSKNIACVKYLETSRLFWITLGTPRSLIPFPRFFFHLPLYLFSFYLILFIMHLHCLFPFFVLLSFFPLHCFFLPLFPLLVCSYIYHHPVILIYPSSIVLTTLYSLLALLSLY